MAHGDYDCCAVCDSKIDYSDDAETKENLCQDCVRSMHALTGDLIQTQAELLAWLKEATPEQVIAAGIVPCFYGNPVDTAVREILGGAR